MFFGPQTERRGLSHLFLSHEREMVKIRDHVEKQISVPHPTPSSHQFLVSSKRYLVVES